MPSDNSNDISKMLDKLLSKYDQSYERMRAESRHAQENTNNNVNAAIKSILELSSDVKEVAIKCGNVAITVDAVVGEVGRLEKTLEKLVEQNKEVSSMRSDHNSEKERTREAIRSINSQIHDLYKRVEDRTLEAAEDRGAKKASKGKFAAAVAVIGILPALGYFIALFTNNSPK
jgi:DNA repair exonuclease SbcCD ATPase subunit